MTEHPDITVPAPEAIIFDIEGTTSSTGFVQNTLYPYSRERFGTYLRELPDDPDVARARDQVIEEGGLAENAGTGEIVRQLEQWLDNDEKRTPLKTLQGLIWRDGFAGGDLTAHFFPDSVPAIRKWHEAGHTLYIFSSGSVNAQRAWFGNSPDGDLLPLFSGHFDTENAGPKKLASSYATIREQIGVAAGKILFFSDLVAELDAAREDGWLTIGVRREGDQYFAQGVGDHREIFSFDQVVFR